MRLKLDKSVSHRYTSKGVLFFYLISISCKNPPVFFTYAQNPIPNADI